MTTNGLSDTAFDLLKVPSPRPSQLAVIEDGAYVVVDLHDKRVLLEVDDLAELARANWISPTHPDGIP
jgi:hypothetical protein